jgi:VCBS repeat-containing protein
VGSGAVLNLGIGDAVEATTIRRANGPAIEPTNLSFQGINIASISALPAVPIIAVNNVISLSIGDPAVTVGATVLLTSHANDAPADLTYTLDSPPSGGDLKLSGTTLNSGNTFTQADIDANRITFEEGGVETDPGGFDFTVRDIAMNSDSGTMVIRVIQAILVAADSGGGNEDTAITEAQLTAGATLLSNDTGNTISVTSFDAVSANGAAISVNPDGTFTYDPGMANALQQLSGGASLADTFTYTVTDTIGKMATATVTVNVTGVNDVVDAVNDFLFAGPLENDASYVSTRSLVGNDGVVRAPLLAFPAGSDLRLFPGKTVSQSPSTGTPPGNGFPENAFDGIFGTFTHTDAVNDGSDHNWQVDFEQLVSLESLTMFNRIGVGAERLRDITVTVLDNVGANVFTSAVLNAGNMLGFSGASGGQLSVNFGGPIMGQTVVITRATLPDAGDPGTESVLSLGEVTIIGSSPVTANEDILLLNYDAGQTANTGRWENLGSNSGNLMDWNLSGVILNSSPGSSRAQITAAYEWDNAADRAVLGDGVNNASIHDVMPGDPDSGNATFEFWVKPANTSQVMTIFETGGGAGFGMIINNGVLEAATELDGGSMNGSYVSYDLVADPAGLVGGNPTTEFNQYAVTITVSGGLQLFVNGVMVSETVTGVNSDWDGGDGSGLGHFGEANHGGFQNAPPVASTYDATFIGSMALFRLYSGVLTQNQIFQNFNAVTNGTDVDGDAITVTGALDSSNMLVSIGSPVTLASGAQVTISNTSGNFTYNSNGVFNLLPGQTTTDTFGYRVTEGNGETADATVTLTITGEADILNDSLTAKEGEMKVYFANAFMGNDEFVSSAVPGAYVNFTPPYAVGAVWTDLGSRATNATIVGGVLLPQELESNFGPIGAGVVSANFLTLDAISTNDVTMEIWFKPDAGQTGKKTIFETGGNGVGYSLVYDPAAGSVIATIDGGTDATQFIQTSATGVSTDEFNQVFVTIDINGGAEVGVATGVFEDIMSIYLNNDPNAAFDPIVDGTVTSTVGDNNDWSGSDGASFNRVNGTSALNENFTGMAGVVSAFRAYQSLLTPLQMEANFDNYAQSLVSVTSPSDVESATVTLNADGSVTVDYSGVSLTPGQSVFDSFAYTSTAGSANVDVTINAYSILEDWRISHGLAADGSQSGSDTDGLDDLLEFAFGTDPNANDNNPLSIASPMSFTPGTQIPNLVPPFTPENVNAQFVRRTDAAAAGLTYIPQFSADLANWAVDTSAPVPTVVSEQAGDYEVVQVPYLVFTAEGKATFYRILVNSTGSGEVSP